MQRSSTCTRCQRSPCHVADKMPKIRVQEGSSQQPVELSALYHMHGPQSPHQRRYPATAAHRNSETIQQRKLFLVPECRKSHEVPRVDTWHAWCSMKLCEQEDSKQNLDPTHARRASTNVLGWCHALLCTWNYKQMTVDIFETSFSCRACKCLTAISGTDSFDSW
jgi:hypothetical protein